MRLFYNWALTLVLLSQMPSGLIAGGHGFPGGAARPPSRAELLRQIEQDRDAAMFRKLNASIDELAAYMERHREDFSREVWIALKEATLALDRAVDALKRDTKETR